MKLTKVVGSLSFGATMLVAGCAGVTQSTEKEAAGINNLYRSGNISGAIQALDSVFNKSGAAPGKDKPNQDTIYYLEKGTFLSNLGQTKLNQSTQNFLVVRNTIQDWEDRTAPSLKMSPKELAQSISDSMAISQFYIPRDYEKSFVGFELMTNHALAKRYDLAFPEGKNTVEIDQFLSQARRAEFEAANEKAKQQIASTGIKGGVTNINQIQGYPVDTFNTKEVLELKNSYLNAGTYYLAGFVSEATGGAGASLAEPNYQTAIKINPSPFFKQALDNAAKKVKPNANQADTLIIVDTGFLSDIYSFKATIPFVTPSGPKAVTWVVPAVRNNAVMFNPQKVDVNGKSLQLTQVSNVEAMSRRELKDQMPTYIARAVASSIVQIVAQEVASNAINKNVKDQTGGLLAKLATTAVVNALASGDVDTRMWKSLPSSVYMARVTLPRGNGTLTIPTPVGPKTVNISLNSPYEVVKLRVFNDGVAVGNYSKPLSESEYGIFTQGSAVKK